MEKRLPQYAYAKMMQAIQKCKVKYKTLKQRAHPLRLLRLHTKPSQSVQGRQRPYLDAAHQTGQGPDAFQQRNKRKAAAQQQQ